MVCEEVSVYVSWLRTMIEFDFKETMINAASYNEMGLDAKENKLCKVFGVSIKRKLQSEVHLQMI